MGGRGWGPEAPAQSWPQAWNFGVVLDVRQAYFWRTTLEPSKNREFLPSGWAKEAELLRHNSLNYGGVLLAAPQKRGENA